MMKRPADAKGTRTTADSYHQKRVEDLLSAFLESFLHQILYAVRLYPSTSFGPTAVFGLRCHVCRHPAVVKYISKFVGTAAPSIVRGESNKVALVLSDATTSIKSDSFELSFSGSILESSIDRLERSLRDTILSAFSLQSRRFSDSATFCLQLHTMKPSGAVKQALNQGEWLAPDVRVPRFLRPIHDSQEPGIQFLVRTDANNG